MTYPVAPEPTTTISTITVSDLQARLADPALTLLDVRPIAAFNGWRLGTETRGGHIPGAAAFPVGWLDAQEAAETARLLADKGATAGRSIVVYGHADANSFAYARVYGRAGIVRLLAQNGLFRASPRGVLTLVCTSGC